MASWWTSSVPALLLAIASTAACGGSSGDPPATADGGVPPGDAGEPLVEAGPSLEGGQDAGPDAPTPAPSPKGYCATRMPIPRFCDDFDDGDLENGWDVPTAVNGDPLLDPTAGTSAPASFAVETFPVANGQSAHVHLRATATGAPAGHVTLSFSVMLATAALTQGVVAIATLDVSPNHFFTLYLRDGDADAPTATLEETAPGGTTRHVLTKLPPANVWTRAVLDIDIGAAKASVSWGAEKALDAVTIAGGAAQDPTIRVGAVYVYGPADAFEARFDDVVLDF